MSNLFKLLIIAGSTLGLAACGGASGAPKAKHIAEACGEASNLGDGICSCVGDLAMEELSPMGREFLDASLREDQARADAARKAMDMEEIVTAGTFMVRAPAACASQG